MRRMITEKEADKLRFIKNDNDGTINLINDVNAKIALDGYDVKVWSVGIRYINLADYHTYFIATPDGIYMDLPTQDPHNKGYLWNDNGTLKISLG